ncbi:MAG: hypothetical protein AAFZ05_02020 [Pseudomonadota bacterium]
MTTINATAKIRDSRPRSIVAFAVLTTALLAGCAGNGTNLLEGASGTPNASLAANPGASAAKPASQVALAPVIGAPEAVASQISTQLTGALKKKGVGVATSATAKSDYTLRGYIVAARERAGTKVSYIWDVTNPTGERVNRITGEEIINGANGRDPWSAVSPTIVAQIVEKTSTSLGNWFAQQKPAPAAQPSTPPQTSPTTAGSVPVAAKPLQTQPAGASTTSRVASASPAAASPTVSQTTTGSISRGITSIKPTVTGAPGDGSTSLASALQRELGSQGVSFVSTPASARYAVKGKVVVGSARSGKQPIQIDWDVRDAKGNSLGTVSQKNEIPAGSLNGAWGRTADAAAGAAAQGIMRLIRQNQTATTN